MNIIADHDSEKMNKFLTRKHMSSGPFSLTNTKNGLVIKTNGDNRDHSQRCVDFLQESYQADQFIRWNNYWYGGFIVLLCLVIHWAA